MRRRTLLWALCFLATTVLAAPRALHAQSGYLDDFVVQVKPEKVTDFEAIARKIADANRKSNGDHWLAIASVYGESNTYIFTSRRQNYADIDKGNDSFMSALNKAFGKDAAQKLFQDFNNCLISSHTQLRIRRPDLSSKMPADAQSLNQLVGESRVLREAEIHVRYGHTADFETYMKEVASHINDNPKTQPILVSQVVEGGHGGPTFHLTFFRIGLGGFDDNPTLKSMVDDDTYARLQKEISEIEMGSQSTIYRFAPDLSNPPDEIAQVAADFWNPKPVMAAMSHSKPKAASAGADATAAKPNQKKP